MALSSSLSLSAPLVSRLDVLEQCTSTNTELVERAAQGWPHFSAVVTDDQTGGRGRLGRTWVAPPGRTLAISVLLRPAFSAESFGWLPLIAGLAMARAVRGALADDDSPAAASVGVKWPNDVLIAGNKVSGLLAELVAGPAVVLGAGVNLAFAADELPTPTATSLTVEGARGDGLPDRVLSVYLSELRAAYDQLVRHNGDAVAAGLADAVAAECVTLGRDVRLTLPSGEEPVARALEIDEYGRLIVRRADDGTRMTIAAGDVTHVRDE
ncbi:biotin--[acetyl-CoA-carboxylase] ligase [Homoserinimonas hongtaonis]|uniref:biotin--[acetyl-CoA-carboxylase] ligase n=1 Tax=Homoserinimonas hongtaonis TaxID=2079791 RepID=UPI000D33470E|nr:biotin--[acetyl-CoA-carboxylase] ligase [Salinibacterium hongtaonis]AWB88595.1 biotin--[acetyl-CoA-carboxylase] ligase [Salinibacterium hongtaonis]